MTMPDYRCIVVLWETSVSATTSETSKKLLTLPAVGSWLRQWWTWSTSSFMCLLLSLQKQSTVHPLVILLTRATFIDEPKLRYPKVNMFDTWNNNFKIKVDHLQSWSWPEKWTVDQKLCIPQCTFSNGIYCCYLAKPIHVSYLCIYCITASSCKVTIRRWRGLLF